MAELSTHSPFSGRRIEFKTYKDWATDTPLSVEVDKVGNALVSYADAIRLRDMLNEILGPPPEPEPVPPLRFKTGDRVKLTGSGWTGVGTPAAGDVVTVLKAEDEPYALFAGCWYVHTPDSESFGKWGGELAPEPTLAENFAALPLGARFAFTVNGNPEGGEIGMKLNDEQYFRGGSVYAISIHGRSPELNLREVTE